MSYDSRTHRGLQEMIDLCSAEIKRVSPPALWVASRFPTLIKRKGGSRPQPILAWDTKEVLLPPAPSYWVARSRTLSQMAKRAKLQCWMLRCQSAPEYHPLRHQAGGAQPDPFGNVRWAAIAVATPAAGPRPNRRVSWVFWPKQASVNGHLVGSRLLSRKSANADTAVSN